MKVQGNDVISRETINAATTLKILGAGAFTVGHYDLNTTAWNFLGRDVTPSAFSEIATIVLIFSIVNLVIHWVADCQSHFRWFTENSVQMDRMWRTNPYGDKEGVLEGLASRLMSLRTTIDVASSRVPAHGDNIYQNTSLTPDEIWTAINSVRADVDRVGNEVTAVRLLLAGIERRFSQISRTALFLLFGWYLTVPIVIGMIAICELWNWSILQQV